MAGGNGLWNEKWPAPRTTAKSTFVGAGRPSSRIRPCAGGMISSSSPIRTSIGTSTPRSASSAMSHGSAGASSTNAATRASRSTGMARPWPSGSSPGSELGRPPATASAVYPPSECPTTPTRSPATAPPSAGSCNTASIERRTCLGLFARFAGVPARLLSVRLFPVCSGRATTKPARARLAARPRWVHGDPPVPWLITTSGRLAPCTAAFRATLSGYGPNDSGCSGSVAGYKTASINGAACPGSSTRHDLQPTVTIGATLVLTGRTAAGGDPRGHSPRAAVRSVTVVRTPDEAGTPCRAE